MDRTAQQTPAQDHVHFGLCRDHALCFRPIDLRGDCAAQERLEHGGKLTSHW